MGRLLHALKEVTSYIAVFIVLLIIIVEIATMLYSVAYLIPHIGGEYFYVPIYILLPSPVLLYVLWGTHAFVWYVFLVLAILSSFLLMLYFDLPSLIEKMFRKPLSYKSTPIQEFSEVYSATLFLVITVTFIIRLLGTETPTIGIEKYPLYFQMIQLLNASVYEELLTRVLLIGVPLFVWRTIESTLKNSKKPSALSILGGTKKIGVPEITLMLISSLIFGYAHVQSWGLWKMFPTFIAGLAMAYLFIRYGVHYSILFHFLTDFLSIPMALNSNVFVVLSLLYFVIAALGVVFTISYSIRMLQHFGVLRKREKSPKERNNLVPPWIDVRCPNCGSQVFIYLDNGKLKCANCGTVFEMYPEQSRPQGFEDFPPQSRS